MSRSMTCPSYGYDLSGLPDRNRLFLNAVGRHCLDQRKPRRVTRFRPSVIKAILASLVGLIALPAVAQSHNRPWEEYSRHIGSRTGVTALSGELFHDEVDLYTGRLSFQHVDIDIPGNFALPVALTRTFNAQDPIASGMYAQVDLPSRDLALGDWELEVPRVSGVFAHKLLGPVLAEDGLRLNPSGLDYSWSDQRCSGLRVPPAVGQFFPGEYWNGLHASMPGGGEMLQPAPGVQSPTTGGGYRWVTAGFTWFSCLSAIKNASGEGFFAVTADGTKYWFDWMAGYREPTLYTSFAYAIQEPTGGSETVYQQELLRKRSVLYATRVEDRFGNWVTYQYSNAATAPARLDKIQGSDGRQITITYNSAGQIDSASDGSRTWGYRYSTEGRLEKVILPDASRWQFNMAALVQAFSIGELHRSSCNYPGIAVAADFLATNNAKLSVIHPSGAVGEFEVGPRLHGRSNVPKQCQAVPDDDGPEAAYSDYVRMYWANSLIRKRITGPGLPTMQWDYVYNNAQKTNETGSYFTQNYIAPGSWAPGPYTYTRVPDEGKPLTDISTYIIADPVCVSDSCAGKVATEVREPGGEWTRYTFGNSYRYNERKLLKVERGTGPSLISRIEQSTYELARSAQPFPTPIGISRQYKGDAITATSLRPLRSKVVTQDGVAFSSVVNTFDKFARPLNVTKSSAPAP